MIDLELLLHALIVLLVGLLSGAPMGIAINNNAGDDRIRAWRVAHSGLSMGGIMLMSMSLVVGHMSLTGLSRLAVLVPSIASGYGFAVSLPFGAWTGHRGLSRTGPWQNRVVHIGNQIGAYGSLISVVVLICFTLDALIALPSSID